MEGIWMHLQGQSLKTGLKQIQLDMGGRREMCTSLNRRGCGRSGVSEEERGNDCRMTGSGEPGGKPTG